MERIKDWCYNAGMIAILTFAMGMVRMGVFFEGVINKLKK